jgi:hypothetical protein
VSTPPTDAPATGPLGAEQRETLSAANARLSKQVLGSAKVATLNAWSLAVFGGLSVLSGLFSFAGLVIGVGLLAFAWNEFRGRALLRKLDVEGPRVLARNQIALVGAVFVYCSWSAYRAWAGRSEELAVLEEALGISADDVAGLTVLVYGIVFVVTAVVLGLTARYHLVRGQRLEVYRAETPEWVIDIQRSMSPFG